MAIQLFCGRPGSGKSYGVLENVILPAIQKKRPISTNIPLNLEVIEADYPGATSLITQFLNAEVNGQFLMSIPGGTIVIIDECWRFWPGGLKANELPQVDKEFFAEHRHKVGEGGLTQEIVLLTQTPAQIAKVIRDLIDSTALSIKNTGAGSEKTFTLQLFSGCIPSIDKPGEPNVSGLGRYKPEIYKYYKSHTKTETGLPGMEIRADKRGSVWSHWYIKYVAPVVFVAAVFGAIHTYKFFSGQLTKKPVNKDPIPEQTLQQTIPTPPAPTPPASQPTPTINQSQRYRISALIDVNGVRTIYVDDSQTGKLIKISTENCKYTLNGAECIHQGEIVSNQTGQRPPKEDDKHRQHLTDVVPVV